MIDNDVWKSGLASTWGLSLCVEMDMDQEQHVVLMDTSGSFEALSKNASKLGVDISDVEAIFISHWHGDHCGCLSHVLPLLKQSIPVYVPSENFSGIRRIEEVTGVPKVCSEPRGFLECAMSTGDLGDEHSLFMNVREKGLVILTGCAHPGVIKIIKRARQISGISEVCAVVGGFHISGTHAGEKVGKYLHEIGVELVSPCHCTGTEVKDSIADIVGERCVRNGSGKIFSFE